MQLLHYLKKKIKKKLPYILLNLYRGYIYGFLIKPQKSYSQKGEDLILRTYFGKNYRNGFYLDIGCFHPKQISNTYLLHKQGWSGFAVDVDEHKTKLFSKFRRNKCKVLTAAVTGKKKASGYVTIYKFGDKGGWSDVDTLDFEKAKIYRDKKKFGDFLIEEVNSISINDLLASLPKINFLNIDIEGVDTEILENMDLKKYKIDVILYEDNDHWGGSPKIKEKMKLYGYKLLFISGGSVCFARA